MCPSSARVGTDELVVELERVVIGAVGVTTRALTQAAPGVELTFPQWRALLVVGERADGARVGEVAARVGVGLPATSRLLRRLERRGLLRLAMDETDRRATRAQLTTQGWEVRGAILGFRRHALREIATALRAADQGALGSVVETMAAEFDRFV
jgi:DNA-binding MarR family transcriptional regulator